MASVDSLNTRRDLKVGKQTYAYYSLRAAEEAGLSGISRLPVSMKVLLENLLRNEDGQSVGQDDLKAIAEVVALEAIRMASAVERFNERRADKRERRAR